MKVSAYYKNSNFLIYMSLYFQNTYRRIKKLSSWESQNIIDQIRLPYKEIDQIKKLKAKINAFLLMRKQCETSDSHAISYFYL